MSGEEVVKKSNVKVIDNVKYNLIKLNDRNLKDYQTVKVRKIIIDKYDTKYILINDNDLIKVSGSMKHQLKNIEDNKYYLSELRIGEFKGYKFYYYTILYELDENDNRIIKNKFSNFSQFVKAILDDDDKYYIDVNNKKISIGNKDYKYIFDNIKELEQFNKKLYNYVMKMNKEGHKNYSSNIINIQEQQFTNQETKELIKYMSFDID